VYPEPCVQQGVFSLLIRNFGIQGEITEMMTAFAVCAAALDIRAADERRPQNAPGDIALSQVL